MSSTEAATRTNGARVPPHDLRAEEALLGAMLLSGDAAAEGIEVLSPSDFYKPAHGHVFAAIEDLYRQGEPADPVTVADQLRASGLLTDIGGPATLVTLQANTPAISNAGRYARIVAEASAKRRLLALAAEMVEWSYDRSATAEDTSDRIAASLACFDLPRARLPVGFHSVDDLVDTPPEEARRPWLVPGLMRAGWRALIVAEEGVGKSVALKSIAIAAGQGIHPFAFTRFEPVRTLIVDLENPWDPIYDVCKRLRDTARSSVGEDYREHQAFVWARQGGIDVRSRADRGRLEEAIRKARPDLVCLGPLYKAFRKKSRESDEEAAQDVVESLDSLRTRHDFALVIEHHAPKQQNGHRDLVPFGSSVWLRWPELGIKLKAAKDPEGSLLVGRFRRDRVACRWPDRLDRGTTGWMWEGRWNGAYGVTEPQPVLSEEF